MTPRKSTAENEGYTVLSDADLRAGIENRVRQLEQELSGHRALVEEAKADPHDDSSHEGHEKAIESLDARLRVARARLQHLRASSADDNTTPPPTG